MRKNLLHGCHFSFLQKGEAQNRKIKSILEVFQINFDRFIEKSFVHDVGEMNV